RSLPRWPRVAAAAAPAAAMEGAMVEGLPLVTVVAAAKAPATAPAKALAGRAGARPAAMQQVLAVARRSPRPAVSIVPRRQPNNSPPRRRGRPIRRVE